MITTTTFRTRSAVVLPASTADLAMGSARKRSIRPFCRSSASPTLVLTAPKATVWTKIARHEIVDVADATGGMDGSAEHVYEQQHEHDGLHRGEKERLRDPGVGNQVPFGHGQRVGHGPLDPGGWAGSQRAHR